MKEYTWDLESVYKTIDDFNKDLNKAKEKVKQITKYKDTMLSSGKDLYNTITAYLEVDRLFNKLWVYASNKHNADLKNTEYQKLTERVSNELDKLSLNFSYFSPTLLKLDKTKLEEFYKEEPRLKEYKFLLEEEFRYKDHTLSQNEESLIAKLSKAFTDNEEISSVLRDSDLDFGYISDENGKKVRLTENNYSNFISSPNRSVRKNAFKTLFNTYKRYINTLSLLLKSHLEQNSVLAKTKHFSSSIEEALYSDNIDQKVYNNLIEVVSKNLDPLFDYYETKKKILKLDDMHLYDIYVNTNQKNDKNYTFEEARDLVLDTVSIFGKEYLNVAKKAFTERWIDVYPREGKMSGGYSTGSYDTKPFILLNYNGKYRDVSTVAHELGHSMHTYFSCKNNPYEYSSYSLFVAEVASTVNELLLANNMLKKSKDKDEKLYILNELLELYKATIYRQTMFAEFDKIVSEKIDNEEVLTADDFNKIHLDLNKKYFGKNIVIDDEIKYEWARIPHFYYNFYVYKYATGLSAASYIVKNILDSKEGAVENYLKFLKSGGSDYPLNELKIAGADLNDPKVVQSAIDMFKDYLEEYKKLSQS